MRTYNLFRRQNAEDLYCAVPVDIAVPPFLTDETWEWAESLDVSQLSDFDAEAAEISANTNGFYLSASISSILLTNLPALPCGMVPTQRDFARLFWRAGTARTCALLRGLPGEQ